MLYADERELLACYLAIRRGTPSGMNGAEPISVQGIESAYRMLEVHKWIAPKSFCQTMLELDSVTLEHYKSTRKP